jgi:hypothetical protein
MSKFIRIVSSNNFINTTENDHYSTQMNSRIENQKLTSVATFKSMSVKELKERKSPTVIIANMVFA